MKTLFFTLALSFLVSCSESESKKSQTNSEADQIQEEPGYALPQIGFHRSVTLNHHFENTYEFLTVDPNGNKSILGDRPYFVQINEDNALEVSFYSAHDLVSVSYVDLGKAFETTRVEELNNVSIYKLGAKEVKDFFREFTYGKYNVQSPEQDMLNKVFIIETQEADHSYLSTMTQLIWVECSGGFKFNSKDSYHCGNGKLKFHYKLIDYKLQKDVH